jgi:ubiquitin-like domain-containing CTD phosphatase 1
MRLLDLSLKDYLPWNSDHLQFRANDDQRTVMSGHTFLRGLFDQELTKHWVDAGHIPVTSLHIADRDRDVVDANQNDCPRLAAIQQEAVQSKAFHVFDNSKELMQVKNYMWNELKMSNEIQDTQQYVGLSNVYCLD